jgi:hypothetical protein
MSSAVEQAEQNAEYDGVNDAGHHLLLDAALPSALMIILCRTAKI